MLKFRLLTSDFSGNIKGRPCRPVPPVAAVKDKQPSKSVDRKLKRMISEEEFCVATCDYNPADFSGNLLLLIGG